MFLPVRDRLPTRTFPFINYLLIIANVLVFFWEQALFEAGYTHVGNELGFVPLAFAHNPVMYDVADVDCVRAGGAFVLRGVGVRGLRLRGGLIVKSVSV